MTSSLINVTLTTFLQFASPTHHTTTMMMSPPTFSPYNSNHSAPTNDALRHNITTNTTTNNSNNTSVMEGCVEIRLSQMEYLPWNNPDNLVGEEVERMARRVRVSILPALFLIGGPANVMNMAVFRAQGLGDRVNLCLFALSLTDELYLVAAMLNYGEEFYLQFGDNEQVGPMVTYMVNNHLNGFLGLALVSMVLSAIIACERCFCVLSPLSYRNVLSTKVMALLIGAVYVTVLASFFLVTFRYAIACVHDPEIGLVAQSLVLGELYLRHKELIDFIDSIILGLGISGGMMAVVVTTTIVTTVKLRQVVAWRSETASTASSAAAATRGSTAGEAISAKEIALTKMLIGNSVLFIICVSPACLLRVSGLFLPELNTGGRLQNFYLVCLWITEASGYVNASFNIFVYYAMGARYREISGACYGSGSAVTTSTTTTTTTTSTTTTTTTSITAVAVFAGGSAAAVAASQSVGEI